MAQTASEVTELHAAVKRGDLELMKKLLGKNRLLANARSETDARGTYPMHVAAEAGQTAAAKLLLDYGADLSLHDLENDSIPLCWAAFFGRPEITGILVARSEVNQRNKHGLTPLGCAVGGTRGQWQRFSNATLDDWRKTAEIIRSHGGVE